jgi:proline racemase
MIHAVKTIDAHAAGQPLRLIADGMPSPAGTTMQRKQQWIARHADHLRRALVLEPRGHADMCAAMLTEPVSPGAHAGVLFMHNGGYMALCGHGLMAVATIALERGLIVTAGDGPSDASLVFDTAGGRAEIRAHVVTLAARRRVDSVAFVAPASFVASPGHVVAIGTRQLRIDIAFGGGFYAIVDTEAIGIPLEGRALPDLRRAAATIASALKGAPALTHPHDTSMTGLEGVVFTGPPHDPEAHLRNVTVFADGAVDRSPCGTGTAAVMAVLDAMGLLLDDAPFVHESVIGTLFRGRIVRRTQVVDIAAIVPEIEGSAWITGEHTFLIDDEDPLREGVRV